jgi:3-hydroxyanthranilate 3,4-dioxygenase
VGWFVSRLATINLKRWIEEHRSLLKPPVGNKLVFEDRDFIVMVVGGPNSRTDYHVNSGEEFFYQLEGDITLKVFDEGKHQDVPISEGEIFLLPGGVPHSPRRPAGTVGLVIEHKREGTEDGFVWFCEDCGEKLYEEYFPLTNIVTQFPPIFERFYKDEKNTICKKCGKKLRAPDAKN